MAKKNIFLGIYVPAYDKKSILIQQDRYLI